MAILVKLDHLLLDRRLTLTELADRLDITIANLSMLKTNKAKAVRFSTLAALCRELNCQPGDLLEWKPDVGYSSEDRDQSRTLGGDARPAVCRELSNRRGHDHWIRDWN
jgi:putative transcriptional regulator